MPELPEVETVVRGLRPLLKGRRIRRVEVRQRRRFGVLRGSLARFRRVLTGARIVSVARRGKYIVLQLEPAANQVAPLWWVIHLGMTGQLYACPAAAPRVKHTHVVAWLSSGRQLRYRDPRRFGKMLVLRDTELAGYFAPLGPEPFRISLQRFCRLFRGRRGPVKSLLLNQSLLRGLGNIYSSEALFLAGVHPGTPAGVLRRPELRRLFRAVRRVLREAIAGMGTTFSDYRTAEGLPGDYQNSLRVYDREGEPCPGCGTAIERVVLAGRSAHFCPRCQPAV
ncbi:MAG: bifunctional DNA-formamidopyrimidine glycosylase/DNA-(apurinic or apyrimidinic site) lyase [Acidobacteria bacterium]|nr:bifunctional DNA-formamidopyrimidine glycosylase/DNA-(apurinic or apyrimidinic site) lyase [Acidobacteriota bacterium]